VELFSCGDGREDVHFGFVDVTHVVAGAAIPGCGGPWRAVVEWVSELPRWSLVLAREQRFCSGCQAVVVAESSTEPSWPKS
jgi:hypothetical protein